MDKTTNQLIEKIINRLIGNNTIKSYNKWLSNLTMMLHSVYVIIIITAEKTKAELDLRGAVSAQKIYMKL